MGCWTTGRATHRSRQRSRPVSGGFSMSRNTSAGRGGDEIVVGPSNARLQGQPAAGGALQDERRKIVAVASPNTFALDSPLVYEHKVQDVAWADTVGPPPTRAAA